MKEELKVYIKGVQNRGNEVIKVLEKQGGIDCQLDGEDSKYLYYINHDGFISLALIDSEFGRIIMDNYREIKLLDKWEKGDILVNDSNPCEFHGFDADGNDVSYDDYKAAKDIAFDEWGFEYKEHIKDYM